MFILDLLGLGRAVILNSIQYLIGIVASSLTLFYLGLQFVCETYL